LASSLSVMMQTERVMGAEYQEKAEFTKTDSPMKRVVTCFDFLAIVHVHSE
jgi:hypothetical protein